MSRPDLQIFGFCFLFFTSYLFGLVRAGVKGCVLGCGKAGGCIFMLFGGSPLSHAAKRHDSSPAGGAKRTCVNRGKVCSKAKPQKSSPYHKVCLCPRACTWLSLRESWREAPERGALQARPQDAPACICPPWPGPSGATNQKRRAPVSGRSGVCVLFQK